MKRILVVCAAAMLCCSLANAQEAEDTGRGAGLSIIPRLDFGALYEGESESWRPSFGNTSLYILFEGNINDKWSFSVANHWLQADGWAYDMQDALLTSTAGLYHLNGNVSNFIDWAYITYAPGNFEFTAGKQVLLMGGFEFDDYDFDVNPFMASDFWNTFTCYQLGITAAYNIPSINSKISFQLATGPVGYPCFALGWDGSYGPLSIKYSALSYETEYDGEPRELLVSLGHRLELGSFALNLDYFNHCGDPNSDVLYDGDYFAQFPAVHGNTVVGSLTWAPRENWDAGIKCAYNGVDNTAPYGYNVSDHSVRYPKYFDGDAVVSLTDDEIKNQGTVNIGTWFSWYPRKEKESLRLQAAAGINTNYEIGGGYLYATIGATWNFSFNLW